MEISSKNVTIRTNAHIAEGKIIFPYQEQVHPLDLMKIEPAGTENFCFVIYNQSEEIIARIGIRDDRYPFEFQYEDPEKSSANYIEEILTIWLDWVFAKTSTTEVYTLIVGGEVEKSFVEKYFSKIENETWNCWWYVLNRDNWYKTR